MFSASSVSLQSAVSYRLRLYQSVQVVPECSQLSDQAVVELRIHTLHSEWVAMIRKSGACGQREWSVNCGVCECESGGWAMMEVRSFTTHSRVINYRS